MRNMRKMKRRKKKELGMNLESEIGVALSGVKMGLFTRFDVKFFLIEI